MLGNSIKKIVISFYSLFFISCGGGCGSDPDENENGKSNTISITVNGTLNISDEMISRVPDQSLLISRSDISVETSNLTSPAPIPISGGSELTSPAPIPISDFLKLNNAKSKNKLERSKKFKYEVTSDIAILILIADKEGELIFGWDLLESNGEFEVPAFLTLKEDFTLWVLFPYYDFTKDVSNSYMKKTTLYDEDLSIGYAISITNPDGTAWNADEDSDGETASLGDVEVLENNGTLSAVTEKNPFNGSTENGESDLYAGIEEYLVLYYSFDDEISNNTISDESDNQYNGTVVGNATIEDSSLYCKDEGYVEMEDSALDSFIKNDNFTLSLLLKPADYGEGPVISNWTSIPASPSNKHGEDSIFYLAYSNELLTFEIAQNETDGNILNSKAAAARVGTWTHVVAVYEDGSSTLYIDGGINNSSQVGDIELITDYADETIKFWLCKYISAEGNNPTYFTGYIDELRLYNTALDSDIIKEIYDDVKDRE